MRKQAIDGYLSGELPAKHLGADIYVSPKHFLKWLQAKKWEFPAELIEEINKQDIAESV